jgi:hypothetical protein
LIARQPVFLFQIKTRSTVRVKKYGGQAGIKRDLGTNPWASSCVSRFQRRGLTLSGGKHMKSILDPTFRYTPSVGTDIRKTFARIRREQRAMALAQTTTNRKLVDGTVRNVLPMPPRRHAIPVSSR